MRKQQIFSAICEAIVQWLQVSEPQPPYWSTNLWANFQFVCRVHGVAPQLYTKLYESDWLPAIHREWLGKQYELNQQRLDKMHKEMLSILTLFADQKVPILPLKGAALSTLVYDDPALRPMADLDLLIRPADLADSYTLMAQLNYQLKEINWKHAEFVKSDNRLVVSRDGEHPENPRKVDLHLYCREMFSGPIVDLTEQMWGTAVIRMQNGRPTYWPHPEMLWQHLLLHTSSNIWNENLRLINLIDIITLAEEIPDPPFPPAHEARFSYLALSVCERYFPGHLPPRYLAIVSPRISRSVKRWVQSIDLINSSHLKEKPARSFLAKWFIFHQGRPEAFWQAIRFMLLPDQQVIYGEQRHTIFRLPIIWFKHFTQNVRILLKLLWSSI